MSSKVTAYFIAECEIIHIVPGQQGDPTSPFQRRSVLGVHWKEWCWSWNSKTLATWCEELTLLKRPWCWERLRAGGERDDGGWDGWIASPTRGHEFGWTLGVGDGQEGLACCDSWRHKESDTTERLNWTELNSVLEVVGSLLRANFPIAIVPWDSGTQTHWSRGPGHWGVPPGQQLQNLGTRRI